MHFFYLYYVLSESICAVLKQKQKKGKISTPCGFEVMIEFVFMDLIIPELAPSVNYIPFLFVISLSVFNYTALAVPSVYDFNLLHMFSSRYL